jgi:hypothetical protein
VLHDLQVEKAREEQRERGEHRDRRNPDAQLESAQLPLAVLEFGSQRIRHR